MRRNNLTINLKIVAASWQYCHRIVAVGSSGSCAMGALRIRHAGPVVISVKYFSPGGISIQIERVLKSHSSVSIHFVPIGLVVVGAVIISTFYMRITCFPSRLVFHNSHRFNKIFKFLPSLHHFVRIMDSEVDLSFSTSSTIQDSVETGFKNFKKVDLPIRHGSTLVRHVMKKILALNSVYTVQKYHRTALQLIHICGIISNQNMELLSIEFRIPFK
jgi:hypothetical protein